MVGILVELAVSWLLLWIIQKRNLSVLGLYPSVKRIKHFSFFFTVALFWCVFSVFLRIQFFKERYEINPSLSLGLVWEGFRWNLVSVLYEELIFRGALLYILIKRVGNNKAIMISAIAFGIYHWFSFNVFGNPGAMIYVFIITGLVGWVLACAYTKTYSIYLATGFHLGWNFINGFVFSKGSIGNGVFIVAKNQSVVNVSYFTFYVVTFVPTVFAILTTYLWVRKLQNFPAPNDQSKQKMVVV